MRDDIYVPSNMLEFKCKMCGQCCSKGWNVIVNKYEYEKIKVLYKDKDQDGLFEQHYKISNENSFDCYARIIDNCGRCKLLNEENLCSKQLVYGEDALTNTCYNYPRNAIQDLRWVEVYAFYSCDAARKTLDTDIPIRLVKAPEGYKIKFLPQEYQEVPYELKEFYILFEEFLLSVIQNRNLSIQERLTILWFIGKKVSGLQFNTINLPIFLSAIENTQRLMVDNLLLEAFRNIKVNLEYQLLYILGNLKNQHTEKSIIKTDLDGVDEIFGLNKYEENINEVLKNYIDQYKNKYEPFEKQFEHIIENYLCQIIFRKQFTKGYLTGLFVMVLHYSMVRFFSVYLCIKYDKNLDKDTLLEAVKIVENGFTHNSGIIESTKKVIQQNKIGLAEMLLLFKM